MPGFGEMLSDNEIWQVSELLKNADKLPPSLAAVLQKQPEPPAAQQPAGQQQQTPQPKGRVTK
jgi:mono/diheme cytochrome c family protein